MRNQMEKSDYGFMKRLPAALLICAVFVAVLAALTACSAKPAGQGESEYLQEEDVAWVTIIDDMGREVRLPRKPERIISLTPSSTEFLFALGLGEKVVGVSEYCNYPPEALAIAKAGDFVQPNIEQIIALAPDFVISDPLQREQFSRLEELEIPFIALYSTSLDDVFAALDLLGRATGAEEEAFLLADEMRRKFAAIEGMIRNSSETDKKVRVYYEISAVPLMSVGSKTVIHDLIEAAGGENIFGDLEMTYPQVSAEAVLERDPEIIVFPDYHGTEGFLSEEMMQRPGWSDVSAIKSNRLYGMDADLISRPGPRVAEAAEVLAGLFYPDLFGNDER